MSGEDKREQEKVRSVLTNHSMSSPCIVSFQVPEDSNDKLQLQYLSEERQFRMIEKGNIENEILLQELKGKQSKESLTITSRQFDLNIVEKGDTWRWRPPIEGGRGNNPIPFQTICGSLSFGNNSIPIMSKMVCDLGNFFSSKWPDLRTNRLQEGGNDTNPDVSWFDTIRKYRAWPKFEGPKFKMKPDLKFQ
ncbi:uncharacterized protein LOC108467278 isoform X1 [Gossypium arboreum]|uniref:uncharacterized protein LOC108467278 isoform X1 n=1 Tax=Gossypium arboreum TaxID=29729 RepID=UPI0008190938|nr:uncharacterized protein LOC108467278 isoform X1 [Gossypium arboreum]